MSAGDDDFPPDIDEIEFTPSWEPPSGDLPGYFNAPESLRDEARRAFTLTYLISDNGVLHPNWLPVWHALTEYLRTGEPPNISEIKALRPKPKLAKVSDNDD